MKTIIIKLLASLASDMKAQKKIIILVLSISVGFIFLLCLPVVVMTGMGSSKPDMSAIDPSQFTEQSIMASLDSEQADKIDRLKGVGQSIETEMAAVGVPKQTIKAQVIYVTYFDNVQNFDANAFANLFKAAPDDATLINSINQTYHLEIPYEQYLHNYTYIMNTTVNPYMFSDTSTKNAADLAAWGFNAYESGWGYKAGFIGQKNDEDRIRYCDNAGLMIGYLNYDTAQKLFGDAVTTLTYTEQGEIDSMPDVPGIGLFDGTKHGIYIGNGEVIFCDEVVGYVTRQAVADGSWTKWCTYEGIIYPPEVQDAIDSSSSSEDSSSPDSESESRGES